VPINGRDPADRHDRDPAHHDEAPPDRRAASGWPGALAGVSARFVAFDRDLIVVGTAGDWPTKAPGPGAAPAEPIGRRLEDVLSGFQGRCAANCRRALAGERSVAETTSEDGAQVYEIEFAPARDDEGGVAGGVAVVRDVTGARRAREELAASEHHFRGLVEEAIDVQIRMAPGGRLVYVSAASEAVLGYRPGELVGRDVHELMHPEDAALTEDRRRARRAAGGVLVQEARVRHADGSWRWIEFTVRAQAGRNAEAESEIHLSARDITERRANEDRRRQWMQTFTSTRRGISIIDPQSGLVQSVNPAFLAMHGGDETDYLGRPPTSFLMATDRDDFAETCAQAERVGFVERETEQIRADGARFPVRQEILASTGSDGRLLSYIVWYEDLTTQRTTELARRQATELFEASFAYAPSGVALTGFDGRMIRVNAALCELLGRPEAELIGSTTEPFTHPDDRASSAEMYADLRDQPGPRVGEKRYLRADGEIVWAIIRAAAVHDADGQPSHIVAHVQDITALKQAEVSRAQAMKLFETAFDDAPIGLALVSLEGHWLKVNAALCELLGYSEVELLSRSFHEITHPDDLDADLRQVQRLVAGEIDRYSMPKRYFTKLGPEVWANLSVSLVRDGDGRPAHFISQIEDISDRKHLEATLQHLADHDHLTKVWNRRAFELHLRRQISQCHRHALQAALLIVDLDGFKRINDTYGHAAGDALLVAVAGSLRSRLRDADCIARLGGDEFAIILPNTSAEAAARVATAVAEQIGRTRIPVDDIGVGVAATAGVTASVGVTPLDATVASEHDALAAADRAMYAHKLSKQTGEQTEDGDPGRPAPTL
jgi:diguanylate cyclase (GGDEF)-like protein/PAS domain S-box-containing protein